jgi:hypothetical protein
MTPASAIEKKHLEELRRAVERLEKSGLAGKYTDVTGRNLERVRGKLPQPLKRKIDRSVEKTVLYCFKFISKAPTATVVRPPKRKLGIVLAGLSGGVGGMLGAPGLFVELPLITILILRAIADIARHSGEDLSTVEGRLACVEVFALGARARTSDGGEGYFATRAKMARLTGSATYFFVERSVSGVSSPIVSRMMTEIVSRFGVALSERAVAGSLPVVGAVASGAVNALFMRYFQNLATAHFTVRRLERRYGAETIRRYYAAIRSEPGKKR